MTPNQPIPADPCQTLKNPICVELSPSKENGADAQVVEGESGACKSAGLRLRWFEPSPTHHSHPEEVTKNSPAKQAGLLFWIRAVFGQFLTRISDLD